MENEFPYSAAMRQVLAPVPPPARPAYRDTPQTPSQFARFTREQWNSLSDQTPLPLTQSEVEHLRGLGDPIDLAEVDAIYRPLTALLQLYAAANTNLRAHREEFLGEAHHSPTPFVIGVAGSVAVGKSSVSRLLRVLMSRWPRTPRVDLVTTDGFLYPNAELERRGIMHRKGFPESYDRRALLDFLTQVKSGVEEVRAPMYSHVSYDILPDQWQTVLRPDVLILEGLNVLAPPRLVCEPGGSTLAVSDFFDFSIYLDANPTDVEEWYVSRYHQLRQTAFRSPNSYFREIASWPREQAEAHARQIWRDVNLVNLVENVAPTRTRATLILEKDTDHRIHQLYLRRI